MWISRKKYNKMNKVIDTLEEIVISQAEDYANLLNVNFEQVKKLNKTETKNKKTVKPKVVRKTKKEDK